MEKCEKGVENGRKGSEKKERSFKKDGKGTKVRNGVCSITG